MTLWERNKENTCYCYTIKTTVMEEKKSSA